MKIFYNWISYRIMKYSLIFIVLISGKSFSQESPTALWQNKCEFKTDGLKKSLGLKIKLTIPCSWKQVDGDRPHVVKKFLYNSGDNSVFSTLTITQMPEIPSKADINYTFSQDGLKELVENMGTFIMGKKIKIDGQDCGEITFKMTRETPIGTLYVYSLQYYIFYKDKAVVLGYGVSSTNERNLKNKFDTYNMLFRGLAGKTVFSSKWE